MFEVFDTVSGRTLAYRRTAREAKDYASPIGGADYEVANEGYYIEVHAHGRPSTIKPIRYITKGEAERARDAHNMASDSSTATLVDCVEPLPWP